MFFLNFSQKKNVSFPNRGEGGGGPPLGKNSHIFPFFLLGSFPYTRDIISSEQLRKLEKIKLFGHRKGSNKKIMTHFAHFPCPAENDPYVPNSRHISTLELLMKLKRHPEDPSYRYASSKCRNWGTS